MPRTPAARGSRLFVISPMAVAMVSLVPSLTFPDCGTHVPARAGLRVGRKRRSALAEAFTPVQEDFVCELDVVPVSHSRPRPQII